MVVQASQKWNGLHNVLNRRKSGEFRPGGRRNGFPTPEDEHYTGIRLSGEPNGIRAMDAAYPRLDLLAA